MPTVQQHYDHHLGPIYPWMIGDFEAALQRQRQFFEELKLAPGITRGAIDLGAGPGLQSIPLAERGFDVLAVDTCQTLLDKLAAQTARSGSGAIRIVCDDVLKFREYHAALADVIVCMGDTLPHLPTLHAVKGLIHAAAAALAPGGVFITTFRDYVSRELVGPQRFIPVRSDERRILTCFLEYFPDHILVHDLVHQQDGGSWRLAVSSYRKLRLAKDWLTEQLNAAGLQLVQDRVADGMICLAAQKTAT